MLSVKFEVSCCFCVIYEEELRRRRNGTGMVILLFRLIPPSSFDISSQAEISSRVTPWATLGVITLTQNEIAEYFAISAPKSQFGTFAP